MILINLGSVAAIQLKRGSDATRLLFPQNSIIEEEEDNNNYLTRLSIHRELVSGCTE